MYRRVIVGHDLREGGGDALALGALIASSTGGELVVAGVFPIGTLPHGFEPQWREEEARIASEIQAVADAAGARAEAFPSSSPARGLHDLAEEIEADLVVVGSSRHSKLGQILAGNVGLGLLHGSPCAVAVAPRGYRDRAGDGLTAITVGFDGSEEARLTLGAALELAQASRARLRLVAVVERPAVAQGAELKQEIAERTRAQLEEAAKSLPAELAAETTLLEGDPAEQLAGAADTPGGLLMLGSRAYGPVRRVLLGSVSGALVRLAPSPLIVHPRGS